MKRIPAFTSALFVLASFVTSQQSWVVDLNGGGDFTNVQQAIDTVADGDVLLLRSGFFGIATVDGKGLTLQALTGEDPVLFSLFGSNPALLVQNLGQDQEVVVRGVTLNAAYSDPFEVAEVRGCAGPVQFEDCLLQPGFGQGLFCEDAESVTLRNCQVTAGTVAISSVPAVNSIRSNLFVYDSVIAGASGHEEFCEFLTCYPSTAGGAGIWLRDTSELYLSNSQVSGGWGGCLPTTPGAPAIDLEDANVTARSRNSVLEGGSAGPSGCSGSASPALTGPGAFEEPEGESRSYSATSPGLAGSSIELAFIAEEGDYVFLLYRLDVPTDAGVWLDPMFALHLDIDDMGWIPMGFVGASGEIVLSLDIPAFGPPGVVNFATQALFSTVDGPWVTSGPSLSVLVGS